MEYTIKSIGKNCAGSGEPLKPGSRCRSVLIERNGEVVRLDYADDYSGEMPENIIGSWVTQVPQAARKTTQQLDIESCFDTFTQLCENPNLVQQKMAYVLSLLLLKKHRLILLDSRSEESHEILQVEGSLGGGPFEIRNFNLPDEEISALQHELTTSEEFSVHAVE